MNRLFSRCSKAERLDLASGPGELVGKSRAIPTSLVELKGMQF